MTFPTIHWPRAVLYLPRSPFIAHPASPCFLQVPWAWHVAYAPPHPERVASPFGRSASLTGLSRAVLPSSVLLSTL